MAADYVIAGLGNPGASYANHRHNAGARALSRLARRHGIGLHAGRSASTAKGRIGDAEVLLVRPRGYYNSSGPAIAPLLRKDGVAVENLIVIYDDLDLAEGRIRLRPRGSAGGNNGLKSIIQATGSSDFGRIRIGIGRPLDRGVPSWDPDVVMRYVLSEPSRAGRALLDAAAERACDAIQAIIGQGWERAMDIFNRREPAEQGEET